LKAHLYVNLLKYSDEALGLGIFMFSAGFFDAVLEYPGLPFRHQLGSALLRRFLVGLSMGLTGLYIFTSRFGKQSGAYINPAITIVRYFLRDINGKDGIFYILFQFAGGSLGMWLVVLLFPRWMAHPAVNYIVTVPGKAGVAVAFAMEFLISFILIIVVLGMEHSASLVKYTPWVVSGLITLFITVEAPFSGMSMNPARTFSSAIVADQWKAFWVYCAAPLTGMGAGLGLLSLFKGMRGTRFIGNEVVD
jgi:aquaporin Z